MFVHVTDLRYWKSERPDLTTCEDALGYDVQQGVFCVADGAGTTLFSNIWADALVKQFVQEPLTSIDPFEMEWWVRQAQKRYSTPPASKLVWNAQQKALEQGAYSTLATMRVTHVDAQTVTAALLVIGDSCVIVGRAGIQQVFSFPLQQASEFDLAPYCVPAMLRNLNRYTLYPKYLEVTLAPGDIVILATDAVARWIVSNGSGQYASTWEAFLEVAKKTKSDWSSFIDAQRSTRMIVDDDSTALMLQLNADGPDSELLRAFQSISPEAVKVRQEAFVKAKDEDNKELLAIAYGDGFVLNAVGVELLPDDLKKAQSVANALRDIMQAVRESLNSPNFVKKIEPVWWQYADLLMKEPCAENVRKSLLAQGVRLQQPADPSSLPVAPAAPLTQEGKVAALNPPAFPSSHSSGGRQPERGSGTGTGAGWQQPVGSEPEMAMVIDSAAKPVDNQILILLRTFRDALATSDSYKIVTAYQSSIESKLTSEERLRLEAARIDLQNKLVARLRSALDQNNDDVILAVSRDIKDAPVAIELTDSEKQRIGQANQRELAYQHLMRVLEEGTAQQKVDAHLPFSQDVSRSLPLEAEEQLVLARQLLNALQEDNDEHIRSVYDQIEFSHLRKYFLFTSGEQQRIRQARSRQDAVQQFRMILQSGSATLTLLNQVYRSIQTQVATLKEDERYVGDLVQRFWRLCYGDEHTYRGNMNDWQTQLVQLYEALYYAPYQLVITDDEMGLVAEARSKIPLYTPPIMEVNNFPVTIKQFLALYHVKPVYARFQINRCQKQLATNPTDQEREYYEKSIDYWKWSSDIEMLPRTVLDDLTAQVLLVQGIEEETRLGNARRYNMNFEKELPKKLDELFFKELRSFTGKDSQALTKLFSEKELRDSLHYFVLRELFSRYLRNCSPSKEVSAWLTARLKEASLSYYKYPEAHTDKTAEGSLCWLFKWWKLRDLHNARSETGSI